MLYAAPERLRNAAFVRTLREIGVGLVVIDEVHCVSMWGHDFRPDYLFIRRALGGARRPDRARDDSDGDTRRGRRDRAKHSAARWPSSARASCARTSATTSRRSAATRIDCGSSSSGCARSKTGARSSTPAPVTRASASHGRCAGTGSGWSTTTQASKHRALPRAGRLRQRPDPRCRRHDGVRDGNRQAGRAPRLPLQLPGLARELRADGRSRRPRRRPERDPPARQPVGRGRREAVRGRGHPQARRSAAASTAAIRAHDGTVEPYQIPAGDHDPRVLVGMLEQAGIVERTFDRGRAMQIELLPVDAGSRRGRRRPARALRARGDGPRGANRALRRERPVPPCAGRGALRRTDSSRRAGPATSANPRRPSGLAGGEPSSRTTSAGTIVRAVESLAVAPRPALARCDAARVGLGSTVRACLACVRGPRGASDAEVKRWIKALEAAGALVEVETDDGFKVLHAASEAESARPRPEERRPVDDAARRASATWRRERSVADGVPAYVVLHDATLRDLAAARPTSLHELAAVKGFGPTKIERYGEDVISVVATAPAEGRATSRTRRPGVVAVVLAPAPDLYGCRHFGRCGLD